MGEAHNIAGVKALTFDVFGTAVDWRGSIIREGETWGRAKGIKVEWDRFADQWRAGYRPAMDKVRHGELPWTSFDGLHRRMLNDLLLQFNITSLTEKEKHDWNRVWHRLHGWPDSVRGLTRLKQKFVISTLSNGNVSMLIDLSKFAGLPWDAVLSAELFRHYKPDGEVYLGAAELLGCAPAEVMMVAAHIYDLRAARSFGLKTAFVSRPLEFGPNQPPLSAADEKFDVYAKDFLDLADQLCGADI